MNNLSPKSNLEQQCRQGISATISDLAQQDSTSVGMKSVSANSSSSNSFFPKVQFIERRNAMMGNLDKQQQDKQSSGFFMNLTEDTHTYPVVEDVRHASHSPEIDRLLYRLFREEDTLDIQMDEEKHHHQIIRKKSADTLTVQTLKTFNNFHRYMRVEKLQSDAELLEIKHNLVRPERNKCVEQNATYLGIVLGNLLEIIDQFITMNNDQVLLQGPCKDIILKFEQLRSDMMNKIKAGSEQILVKSEMTSIFGKIRFVLTRFGRIINLYDQFQALHSRKVRDTVKQAPAILRIQQLEQSLVSTNNHDSDLGKLQSPVSGNSISSLFQSDGRNLQNAKLASLTSSPVSIVNHSTLSQHSLLDQKNLPVYRMVQQVSDTFNKLTQKEKVSCIEKYLKQLSTKWREEYEQERKLNVPLIVCRICSQNFYADKEKQHSQYCIDKINKTKALPLLNQKFLDLSYQLTECMLHIEKMSQSNTPRLTPCQNKSQRNILMTPTLQRRIPLFNMMTESAQESVNHKLSSNSLKDKMYLPIVAEEQQVFKKTNFDQKLSDTTPNNKALVAQQKLLSMVPRILAKVTEAEQTKPPINSLQMYSVRQPLIDNSQQQIKPQTKKSSNAIFSTLNTLKGLESSNNTQGPKLFSGGNEIKKQPSIVIPKEEKIPELLEEEQKITPSFLQDVTSAIVISPQYIENSSIIPIIIPVLQKKVLELKSVLPKVEDKTNQIRSILKMSDATGIQMQPFVRKIEPAKNDFTSVNVKVKSPSPPLIKRSLNPNSQISKLTSSLRSLEKLPIFKQQDLFIQTMPNKMTSGDFLQSIPPRAVQMDIGVQEIIKLKEIPKVPKSEYIINAEREHQQMIPDDLNDKYSNLQLTKTQQLQKLNEQLCDGLSSQQRITEVSKNFKKKYLAIGHLNASTIKDSFLPFSIELKKEKEDALKNIEQLRRSVKLQKRASPFEKIISKLVFNNETKFVEIKHQVLKKQSSIAIHLLHSIDDLSKQDESQVIKSRKNSMEEIKSDNCKNSPMDYLGVGGYRKNLQVGFEGMSPIIAFRPLNRFGLGSDNSSTGTPILAQRSITETGSPGSQGYSQWIDDNTSKVFTTLQSAKQELEILENLKTLALDIFNLASQLNQFKEKRIVLQRYKSQLEQMANADQNKYFSLGIKSLSIVNQFIALINEHLKTINDLDQLEKHYKMTLPWQKEPDLYDTSSRLSRQMNISISSKEAPVGSSGQIYKQSGSIFNQIYSPRLEPSRTFQPNETGYPNNNQSPRNFQNTNVSPIKKLTQTPMLTSRELFLQGNNKKQTSDQIIAQKARSALL